MGKFRKKPVVIEAFQLPQPGEEASDELIRFLHSMDRDWTCERDGALEIQTLEGNMMAAPGDWIIKGVQGEYYPCKPDIFEQTYEKADD